MNAHRTFEEVWVLLLDVSVNITLILQIFCKQELKGKTVRKYHN